MLIQCDMAGICRDGFEQTLAFLFHSPLRGVAPGGSGQGDFLEPQSAFPGQTLGIFGKTRLFPFRATIADGEKMNAHRSGVAV